MCAAEFIYYRRKEEGQGKMESAPDSGWEQSGFGVSYSHDL